jgi:hypothetical protein
MIIRSVSTTSRRRYWQQPDPEEVALPCWCPARYRRAGRHRRQILPIKDEQTTTSSSPTPPGTQASSKQAAAAAMRSRRLLLLLLLPLHGTLASSCRAPPASVGWVGQLTLHAGRDRDMAPSIQKGRRKTSSTQSPAFPPPALAYMLLLLLRAAAQVRREGGGTLLSRMATTGRRGLGRERKPSSSSTRDHWGERLLVVAMLQSRLLMLHRGGDGKPSPSHRWPSTSPPDPARPGPHDTAGVPEEDDYCVDSNSIDQTGK